MMIYDVMIFFMHEKRDAVSGLRLEIQQEILVLPEQRRGLCGASAVLGPGKRFAASIGLKS